MRWIMTEKGDVSHAVPSGAKQTLCGIDVARAVSIVPSVGPRRCYACDAEWRSRGRKNKPPAPKPDPATYNPRHKFEDD